jgi:hypothetical protein
LRDSSLPARSLVLELTESAAMENPAATKTLLMQLRAMGIRISVDDFGTGYSSLAYLRQFPVDTLKVDRSFVRGMETHKDSAEIVSSLTALAQELGLHVVAEGVENDQQLSLLRALRCDSAQGYLWAKPLDVDKATDALRNGLRPASTADGPATRAAARLASITEKRAWLSHRGRGRLAIAAVLVLTAAAVIAWLTDGQRVQDQSSLAPAQRNGDLQLPPAVPASIQTSRPTAVPRPQAKAESEQEKAGSEQAKAGPETPIPATNVAAIPVLERPSALIPVSAGSIAQTVTAVSVVHLHRVGSCQGDLVVSRDAISFVPSDKANKDAFVFKYGEFLHTLSEGLLTIRSASRTYRFRAAAADGNDDRESQLTALVKTFPRIR